MQNGMKKEKNEGSIRLNKYLSDAGFCFRREADRLIEKGCVSVDGKIAQPGVKVTSGESVTVNGKELKREEELILLALNKPAGVVCSTKKRAGEKTIYELLNYPKRIFSIGRLDKDSEGLLLMTNYGDIFNKIMRSENHHEKEYLVTVNREIKPDFLRKMARGVRLEGLGVRTQPCKVELAGKNKFRIVLRQGLNRQIRRMCEALGYKVTRLVRIRIMNIELGNLRPGEYRRVGKKEYARLMALLRDSKNPGHGAGGN